MRTRETTQRKMQNESRQLYRSQKIARRGAQTQRDRLDSAPLRLCARLPRSGLTLIELLVVIIILTTLVAAAIPILAPAGSDRETREATRGLNTFITGAQTRATALRRPFGIALKRLSQDTNTNANKNIVPAQDIHDDNGVCLEVYYVEQQPPYAGFDANSRACVALDPNQSGQVRIHFVTRGKALDPSQDGLPLGWDPDLFPANTIRSGDVIEIGDTRYVLVQLVARNRPGRRPPINGLDFFPYSDGSFLVTITAQPINDTGQQINPKYDNQGVELGSAPSGTYERPYWTSPAPYKIFRQPTSTSDPPYQLPEGTAIDLRASGIGSDDYFYVPGINDNSQPVVIMFTPEGRVDRVAFSQLPINGSESARFDEPIVDSLYLLVGKRENIPAPAVDSDMTLNSSQWSVLASDQKRQETKAPVNWLLGLSRWVVIGSQSGRVVSVENAAVDPLAVINDPTPPIVATESTEPMRTRQILAAREFTFDMANMGGR
jgi:prepilin-type N-terminal cleavage/methylation domain-containing protein